MRHIVLILLAIAVASVLASQAEVRSEPVFEASGVRGPDRILGAPIYGEAEVERYARSVGCTRYIMKTIPLYFRLAPRRNIRPDVLVAQAILETGKGHYGGDSRPWNMAGIKKGGAVGDEPSDFEVPKNAPRGREDARKPHGSLHGQEAHRQASRPLLRRPRRPGESGMVGEEGEPTRKRGVGHRSSLRRQDSAHTGRYGDTLILPAYTPVVISGVPPPRSPSALALFLALTWIFRDYSMDYSA